MLILKSVFFFISEMLKRTIPILKIHVLDSRHGNRLMEEGWIEAKNEPVSFRNVKYNFKKTRNDDCMVEQCF